MQEAQAIIGLYDKNGNLLGFKERDDVNKRIDILKVVNVMLFDEKNRIFITKPKDDLWKEKWGCAAAGLVRKDESSVEAARRTLKRELNLEAEDLIFLGEKYFDLDGIKRFISIFYARTNKDPRINHNDVNEGTWVDLEELKMLKKKNLFNPPFLASFEVLKAIVYFL